MKHINQNNIDEWLFEYFEGNLTESESDQLLAIVGSNSEFRAEFNYWKESYLKDYPSVQYATPEKLKRNSVWKSPWFNSSVLLLLGALIYFSIENQPNVEIINNTKTINKTLTNKSESKIIIPATPKLNNKQKTSPLFNKTTNTNSISINTSTSNETDNAIIPIDSLVNQESFINHTDTATIIENKPSIISSPIIEKSQEKTKTKNKHIRLKNIHLKPSEEINKMNPNF